MLVVSKFTELIKNINGNYKFYSAVYQQLKRKRSLPAETKNTDKMIILKMVFLLQKGFYNSPDLLPFHQKSIVTKWRINLHVFCVRNIFR